LNFCPLWGKDIYPSIKPNSPGPLPFNPWPFLFSHRIHSIHLLGSLYLSLQASSTHLWILI
jgi:hypothetical protein